MSFEAREDVPGMNNKFFSSCCWLPSRRGIYVAELKRQTWEDKVDAGWVIFWIIKDRFVQTLFVCKKKKKMKKILRLIIANDHFKQQSASLLSSNPTEICGCIIERSLARFSGQFGRIFQPFWWNIRQATISSSINRLPHLFLTIFLIWGWRTFNNLISFNIWYYWWKFCDNSVL